MPVVNLKMQKNNQQGAPLDQISYMVYELGLIVNNHHWRWLTLWFGGVAGIIISYRLDRLGFLLFKAIWPAVRIMFFPFFLLLRLFSYSHEIHYAAEIGRGLKILHPSLGIVISGHLIAGEHLTLTGGNCLGQRKEMIYGEFVIGDHVSLGANAVILGPLSLGNNVKIGAGAVVVNTFPGDVVLVGVPAKAIRVSLQ